MEGVTRTGIPGDCESMARLFLQRRKKRRRTSATPRTPTKGRMKQHKAGAPYRGARAKCCLHAFKSARLRLVVFEETALDARASFGLSSQAAGKSAAAWKNLYLESRYEVQQTPPSYRFTFEPANDNLFVPCRRGPPCAAAPVATPMTLDSIALGGCIWRSRGSQSVAVNRRIGDRPLNRAADDATITMTHSGSRLSD